MLPMAASAQDPFTYETVNTLGSTGDINGDNRRDGVFVDRVTGNVRVAFQQADGTFLWSAPQPGGIETPETLTVGRFYSSADGIAIGSGTANRIHLFSLATPSSIIEPKPLYPKAPGPSAMTGMQVDGVGDLDILAIGESLPPASNTGKGKAYETLLNVSGNVANGWSTSFPNATVRVNPARPKTTEAPRLCEVYHATGASTATFYLEAVTSTGLASAISAGSITPNTRYVPTILDGGTLTQFLFWEPGATTFQVRRIQEPTAGTFSFGTATTFTLPAGIENITPVPQGSTGRIAVLFTNRTVGVYGFNGSAAPTLVQTISGTGHEMVLPFESGSFLIGSNLRGAIPSWKKVVPSGGTYSETMGGNLQPARITAASNILFLSAEPFVNVGVTPRRLSHFRDWTTSASAANSPFWSVFSLAFSETTGLGSSQGLNVSATSAGDYPLLNQYSSGLSFFVLQPQAGIDQVDVLFSPPPGNYAPPIADNVPAVTISLSPTMTGYKVFYRRNPTAAFTQLPSSGQIQIVSSSAIEAYAQKTNGPRSPIRKGTYTIQDPSALAASTATDLDGDGMSDEWERLFGLNDPTADSDGDGASNLSEYLAGTDPRNNTNGPPAALVLTGAVVNVSGSNVLRLEWTDPTAVLKKSTDLGTWGPHGATIQTIGNTFRADIPITGGVPPKAFYRLEK
jgi:hypothetical protein